MRPLLVVSSFLLSLLSLHAAPRAISITTELNSGTKKSPTQLGSIVVKPEATASVVSCKIFYSPTKFDKPIATKTDAGLPAYIPIFPTEFESHDIGWKITYEASEKDGLITLVGKATYSDVRLVNAVYGEYTGPIYDYSNGKKLKMSNNIARSGAIDTSSTQFQIFAKPGKSYTVQLKQLNAWIPATITCDLVNPVTPVETKLSLAK